VPGEVGRDRGREAAVCAAIYMTISMERRAATFADLRAIVDGTQREISAALAALRAARKVKRVITWGADTGPEEHPRYVYVPADRRLARGIGFCATAGCDRDPQVVVAGHALCRACARGPVDPRRGGGQFRSEGAEARTQLDMTAQARGAPCASGGWEPDDGGERVADPLHPGRTVTTEPRGKRRRNSCTLTVQMLEAEFTASTAPSGE
jgi:hypothetical protein